MILMMISTSSYFISLGSQTNYQSSQCPSDQQFSQYNQLQSQQLSSSQRQQEIYWICQSHRYQSQTPMMKTDTIIVPLYRCYVFGNNEFSMEDLQSATEESAQYNLHVVGLVMHRVQRILFVADPNGALIGESNMEFLAMLLKKLISDRSTTKVSAYDRSKC